MNVETCLIDSHFGIFDFYCFNFGNHEEDNVLVFKSKVSFEIPYVRIQSACFTAEIFRSKDCDCHEQLVTSMDIINRKGGLFIYLLQDGRGAGIFNKTRGLHLSQTHGIDTADAYDKMNINRDPRAYDRVIEILKYFKIENLNLLTNNPRKLTAINNSGITVNRMPLEIEPTENSFPYLKSKKEKLGHMFNKYIK